MEIIFRKYSEVEMSILKPVPAVKKLPDWYKKISPYTEGSKPKFFANGTKNITIKRCNPVGDALTAGYFLVLDNDIYVNTLGEKAEMVWYRGGQNYVSQHTKNQIDIDLIPNGFNDQPFKFTNNWSMQTPKGYSVLISHPFNRNAEPFLTLSGVIDTDTYHTAIQLPFLIKENFEGIIESGTPIAQIIPFKREKWKSKFLPYSSSFYEKKEAEFNRVMSRFYKRFHWNRKEYT